MAEEPKAVSPQQPPATTPAKTTADESGAAPASTDATADEPKAVTPKRSPASTPAETTADESEAASASTDAKVDEPKAVTPQQSPASTPAETTADESEAASASTDARSDEPKAVTPQQSLASTPAETSGKSEPTRRSRNVAHWVAAILVLMLVAYAVYDVTHTGFLERPWEWLLFVAVYGMGVFLPVYKGIYWRVRHDRGKPVSRIAHWVAAALSLALGGFLLLIENGPIGQSLLFSMFGYLAFYWAVRGIAWTMVKLFGAPDAVGVT